MVEIILFVVLLISVITDIKSRKILNVITFPAILIGLTYHMYSNGIDGLFYSGKGLLVGFVLLLIPFMMGGIGAGDVKLLAAIGSLKGTLFVFYTFLYAAVIGGIIALVIMLRQREFKNFLTRSYYSLFLIKANHGSFNLSKQEISPTIPYGVPIALGVVCNYFLGVIL